METMVALNLPSLVTDGKVVRVQAWRGDNLIGVYPTNPRTRKRLSPTKIRNIKQWFKEHHGCFEQVKEDDVWKYKETQPYIRFVLERAYQ